MSDTEKTILAHENACNQCGHEPTDVVDDDPRWYILDTGRLVWWCYCCAHEYDGRVADLR